MKKTVSRSNPLPRWFLQNIPEINILKKLRQIKGQGVNTVCLEARCPNWSECLRSGALTFMILGDTCTRNCKFCAVKKDKNHTPEVDEEEPYRILKVVKDLGLKFIVITSVTRDDLDDSGAGHFIRTIRVLRQNIRDIKIEILIPDFLNLNLKRIVQVLPDVLAHNMETVPRLYPRLRSGADYRRSLKVINQAKEFSAGLLTKSALILGMGEKEEEVFGVMCDLKSVNCDILVLGQYLKPNAELYPVKEFISPEQFKRYKNIGLEMGFSAVLSSPLARASYLAEKVYFDLKKTLSISGIPA